MRTIDETNLITWLAVCDFEIVESDTELYRLNTVDVAINDGVVTVTNHTDNIARLIRYTATFAAGTPYRTIAAYIRGVLCDRSESGLLAKTA